MKNTKSTKNVRKSLWVVVKECMTLIFAFSLNNAKIKSLSRVTGKRTAAFDLLAGTTCPSANICRAHVQENPKNGKLNLKVIRGKFALFLCYAAKLEAVFTNVYLQHKRNTNKILEFFRKNDFSGLVNALVNDITTLGIEILRIHASGDFFNKFYAMAFLEVAKLLPNVQFFGYTKVYNVYRLFTDSKLENLNFAFSIGSRDDSKVTGNDVTCQVFLENQTYTRDGNLYAINMFGNEVRIVCNVKHNDISEAQDYYMIKARESFGLIVH